MAANGKLLYELFFPVDGIPILAILALGDEHEFLCEVRDPFGGGFILIT